MTLPVTISELFVSKVTRDIAPVVWFHETSPEKLQSEVSEYIVTGGWPDDDPRHTRVPNGIHEQFCKLLAGIAAELEKPGGAELPVAWISGFYGSGKSSFAKLLGLALDGVELPDGRSLADALLERDASPRAGELREAWERLQAQIDPMTVIFDVGGLARGGEHLHSVIVRQLQARLGYCSKDAIVADFELDLERDGQYARFLAVAEQKLGRTWSMVKDLEMAEEEFSLVMHHMYPDRYRDPMAWYISRSGTRRMNESPEEAVAAIADMLRFRSPKSTVFFVVDEVSQFVLGHSDRVDRLRAFVTALGARLRGKAWMWALGQQKLDEHAGDSFLVWAKDRFPPRLRVEIEPTNIRDVVHQRLLRKKPALTAELRALFERHRPALALYAYDCADITADDFVEVYPMLPGHIALIMEITSAMRTRSPRAQGDDHAIRGLLQLLGELFRSQRLADASVGSLVTFDRIYDVQHTALDSDTQQSMSRVLDHCAREGSELMVRVAKVVAMLELLQERKKDKKDYRTDAKLVAQCLYERLDLGNREAEVAEALDALHRAGLLGYAEKTGYKIQSTAGEEWEREQREIGIGRETIGQLVQESLKYLMGKFDRPRLHGRSFRWEGRFSDGRTIEEAPIADPRDDAPVTVDFRLLYDADERLPERWIRGGEGKLRDRLVWVCGNVDDLEDRARGLGRSREMIRKYDPRRESLPADRKLLLQQEKNRVEDLERAVQELVARTYLSGQIYFRGEPTRPSELGGSFERVIEAVATRNLPKIYPHFIATQVAPAEVQQLMQEQISGPSPKFLDGELGLLAEDGGRFVFLCNGVVPLRVLEFIKAESSVGGARLLTHFGGPPYGYTPDLLRACTVGLLRAKKIKIRSDGGAWVTAQRDAGFDDVFGKDRGFRRASFDPADEDELDYETRSRISGVLTKIAGRPVDREDHQIAEAVAQHFPGLAQRLRAVLGRLQRLPGTAAPPGELTGFHDALEQSLRQVRQTLPTVLQVKKHLEVLRAGAQLLANYEAELTDVAVEAVRRAAQVHAHHAGQLRDTQVLGAADGAALARVEAQLAGERPWRDIEAIAGDLGALVGAYVNERRRLLQWQEEEAEALRAAIRSRPGYGTLSPEQTHRVMRPIAAAVTTTSEEALAPSLRELHDTFLVALKRAEDEAQEELDRLLSDTKKHVIIKVDLGLKNRQLASEADVEALLVDLRERLLQHIRNGTKVRVA